ncbi:MAG: hypothetical protein GY758_31965 [Fuerstiella sp.]|nr:hypothetical protein [Fuerstiella sp.]MCP4508431.1 hypothetical protein [Fuerstiella sp.]MDG2128276.1 hypothetical protein [Fuerstiella sp.]
MTTGEEMMAKDWDPGNCNEKSGFLFSHECFQPPVDSCNMCSKPVCQEHSHSDGAAVVCTSCAKKDQQRVHERGGSRRGRSRYYDDHDPYFYGGYYYGSGYHDGYYGGHSDPLDFTEADSASLETEGDEQFESDMSAS